MQVKEHLKYSGFDFVTFWLFYNRAPAKSFIRSVQKLNLA